jgi:hypothetical protein
VEETPDATVSWTTDRVIVAASGDLAVELGTCTFNNGVRRIPGSTSRPGGRSLEPGRWRPISESVRFPRRRARRATRARSHPHRGHGPFSSASWA